MYRKFQASIINTILVAALCCAGNIVKAAEAPTTAPSAVEIQIDNFTFTPATVTITPGTKVTWINHDDIPHTATSTTKVFNSKALDTDEKYSFVFDKPGTYPYFCAVHPHMTGQIIVK